MENLQALFEKYGVRVDRVIETVGLLIVAAIVILYIGRFIKQLLLNFQDRTRMSYETLVLMSRLVTAALWVATGLLILNFWGVSVSGLWTLIASVSAVIGVGFLAVWTMVSNITANLFITIWRPFRMGATIEILPENLKGRVIDRNLMFTVLRDSDGAALFVPNNMFFQKMFRVSNDGEQHLFEYLERQRQTKPDMTPQ